MRILHPIIHEMTPFDVFYFSGKEMDFLSSSRMSATEQARFPESEAMNGMCRDFHMWWRSTEDESA